MTGLKHSRLARLERFAILLVSSYSTDQLLVHRTVDPSRQLTAACSANWAIEAYSVCCSELKKYKRFMFNHMYQAYSDNKYYPVVRWIMSFVLFFWAINKKCRRRLIFPGGCPPSIFSAEELNYRVRDGNGWTLFAIDTDSIWNTVFSVFLPFLVTRSGFEPLLPAWEAGVLGHLTNGPQLVHHHGLEPWTPWLRVRCSTNWANGAHLFFTPSKLNKEWIK